MLVTIQSIISSWFILLKRINHELTTLGRSLNWGQFYDKKHHKAVVSDAMVQKRSVMKSDLLICELISPPFLSYKALVTISSHLAIGRIRSLFSLKTVNNVYEKLVFGKSHCGKKLEYFAVS